MSDRTQGLLGIFGLLFLASLEGPVDWISRNPSVLLWPTLVIILVSVAVVIFETARPR
jgi:hypothetical protein